MRNELKGFSAEELELAARQVREASAQHWDQRLADENDALEDLRPVKVKVSEKPSVRTTVGLRLAQAELGIIEQAAKARGVSFSEFVREAALAAASGAIADDAQELGRLTTEMRLKLQAFQDALERVAQTADRDTATKAVVKSVTRSKGSAGEHVRRVVKPVAGSVLIQRSRSPKGP